MKVVKITEDNTTMKLLNQNRMTAKQIRWSRIIKHSIQYFFTLNKIYKYEIEHYYYMVKFKEQ